MYIIWLIISICIYIDENGHLMSYHNLTFVVKYKSAFKMVNECFWKWYTKVLQNKYKNIKTKKERKNRAKNDKSEFNIPFSKLPCVYKKKKCVCIHNKKLEKMIMHTRTAFITKQLRWY